MIPPKTGGCAEVNGAFLLGKDAALKAAALHLNLIAAVPPCIQPSMN
jgi:hypothetical protein